MRLSCLSPGIALSVNIARTNVNFSDKKIVKIKEQNSSKAFGLIRFFKPQDDFFQNCRRIFHIRVDNLPLIRALIYG